LLPYDSAQAQGWGAAAVLIMIILAINIGVRYYFATKNKKGGFIAKVLGGYKR
jgi:phosphate transport system permease protein